MFRRSRRGRFGGPYGYPPDYPPPGYPPGYRGYGPPRRFYRRPRSLADDLCLLETGCCIAEGLDCMSLSLVRGPALVRPGMFLALLLTLVRPAPGPGGRALAAIRFYQREISARRRSCCRFSPSCSEYAAQAVVRYGTWRGGWLGARRLLRCRPGAKGGYDPVP